MVARQVRKYRLRRGLSVRQLAEECAKLGAPQLTSASLGNIERGQDPEARRKRRDVTVDELLVLGKALKVAPSLLMFPVGEQAEIEVAAESVDTWDTFKWFNGEAYFSQDVNEYWAIPIYLFREHDRLRSERLELMFQNLPTLRDDGGREGRERLINVTLWDKLKNVRAEMRRTGLTPPPAVDDLEGIDDRPRLYMTADEAEARIAAGEQVRVVDSSRPGGLGRSLEPGHAQTLHEAIQLGRELAANSEAQEGEKR